MTKVLDLDAKLAFDDDTPIHTRDIILFGQEWTVVCDANAYALSALSSGDVTAYRDYLVNTVILEQREAMHTVLLRQRGLTAERFVAIIEAVFEVVSEGVPTTRASASSRTPAKKTSSRTSAAPSSSKARAVRSVR
jgi:hypothetical protein